jgi:DnaJ-like protein
MRELVDAYALLGVPPDAPQATLKQAHRRLAWRHHPDRAPEDQRHEATRRIQEINVAYGLVRTPAARARYDALRTGAPAARVPAPSGWEEAWDELMRQAGRWAGQWWRRNEGPLRRAITRARRSYVELTGTITVVAFAWVGLILALGAAQLMQVRSPLPTIVGAAGGGLAGVVHRRDRLRALDGHPPMRHVWLPTMGWLVSLALTLVFVAR